MFEGLETLSAILIFLLVVVLAVCAAGIQLAMRYDMHMLQLSSYQQPGYFRSLRAHPTVFLSMAAGLAVFVFYILLPGRAADAWVFMLPAVLDIILFFPRKVKKKFVITKRVQRLIVITYVLFAAVLAVSFVCSRLAGEDFTGIWKAVFISGGVFLALHPAVVSLGNLIAKPIERSVQNWYIRDAQRMIKEHPGLRIVGITGSFGKTSVKHYLTTMLSEQYSVLMTPGSFNTPMGVVRTIRENLRPTHEIFVCEMGARHVGDIKEICDIVHPHDGILTAIGDQHLETFHTRENIISTKYELLDAVQECEAGGSGTEFGRCLKFANGDDENIRNNFRYSDTVTYGLGEDNTYRGEILSVGAGGTTFRLQKQGEAETAEITMPLVGRHNVVNVIGAIAAAHELGVSFEKCRTAAKRLKAAEHRLEIKQAPYGVILDDAYNSNPAGAAAALETMDAFDSAMLKILITPGMVELGEKQEEYNREFGGRAAKVCDLICSVGRTNSDAIRKGALDAGFPEEKIKVCQTLGEAMNAALALSPGRKRVLLLENDLPDDYS